MPSTTVTTVVPQSHLQRHQLLVLEPSRLSHLQPTFLTAGRYLIGRAESSTIRVDYDGVQDRHALILVGDQVTLVKALDERTWINDLAVTETKLRPGDRLSIGPITFRVRSATSAEVLEFADQFRAEAPTTSATPSVVLPEALSPQRPWPKDDQPLVTGAMTIESLPPIDGRADHVDSKQSGTIDAIDSILNELSSDRVSSILETLFIKQPQGVLPAPHLRPSIEIELAANHPEIELPPLPNLLAERETELQGLSDELAGQRKELERAQAQLDAALAKLDLDRKELVRQQSVQELAQGDLIAERKGLADQAQSLRDAQAASRTELERITAEYRQRTTRLEAERRALMHGQDELAAAHKALDNQRTEWAATQQAIAEQSQAFRSEQAEFHAQLDRHAVVHRDREEQVRLDRQLLDTVRDDLEAARQAIASERAQLIADRAAHRDHQLALQNEQLEFHTELERYAALHRDREEQIDVERHSLHRAQDDLATARQALEADRTAWQAERAAELSRLEQDADEQAAAWRSLNDHQDHFQAERSSHESSVRQLAADKQALANERSALQVDRETLTTERKQIAADRVALAEEQQKQSLDQSLFMSARQELEAQQAEFCRQRRRLDSDLAAIESTRQSIDQTRDELTQLRSRANQTQLELSSDRSALLEREQALATAQATLEAEKQALRTAQSALTDAQWQLQSDRQRLDSEWQANDLLTNELTETRRTVHQQSLGNEVVREQLAKDRQDLATERAAYDVNRADLDRDRAVLIQLEKQINLELEAAITQRHSLETVRDELDRARSQVDDATKERLDEQLALMQSRQELEAERAALEDERQRFLSAQSTLAEQRRQIESDHDALKAEHAAIEAARHNWDLARSQSEDTSQSERAELAETHQQLVAERTSLEIDRQQFASAQSTLAEQRRRFETDRDALEDERNAIEAARREWVFAQNQSHETSQSQLAALSESRQQLQADRASFDAERDQFLSAQSTLAEQWRRFEDDRDALEVERTAIETARREWVLAQNQSHETSPSQLEDLFESRQRLQTERASFDAERDQFLSAQSSLADQRGHLENELDALQAERESIEAARLQWEQRRAESDETTKKELAELTVTRQELSAERVSLDAERQVILSAQERLAEQRRQMDDELEAAKVQRQAIEFSQSDLDRARTDVDEWTRHHLDEERRLTEVREWLATERAELEAQRNALSLTQSNLAVQQRRLEDHLVAFKAHQQAIETAQNELNQVNVWDDESPNGHLDQLVPGTDLRNNIANQQTQLDQQKHELEVARSSLAEEQRKIADDLEALRLQREVVETDQSELYQARVLTDETRASLLAEQDVLLERQHGFAAEQAAFETERQALAAAQATLSQEWQRIDTDLEAIKAQRREIEQTQDELIRSRAHIHDAPVVAFEEAPSMVDGSVELDSTPAELLHQQQKLSDWHQLLQAQQGELDALQLQLERSRQELESDRLELEEAATALHLDRQQFATEQDVRAGDSISSHPFGEAEFTLKDDRYSVFDRDTEVRYRDPGSPDAGHTNLSSFQQQYWNPPAPFDPRQSPEPLSLIDNSSAEACATALRQLQSQVDVERLGEADHHSRLPETNAAPQSVGTGENALTDVNQQFGCRLIMEERTETEPEHADFESQTRIPDSRQRHEPTQAESDDDADHPSGSGTDNLVTLRAQLAQMFDLSQGTSPTPDHESAVGGFIPASIDDDSVEEPQSHRSRGVVDFAPPSDDVDQALESNPHTNDTGTVADNESMNSTAEHSSDTSEDGLEDEDPWTRRLRELSAVAQGNNSPPVQQVGAPEAAGAPRQHAARDEDQSLIEAQMARLLGRKVDTTPTIASAPRETAQPSAASMAESDAPDRPAAVLHEHDRSHLSAAPRHKQNKHAVREEVQSFREVAQMSARTALEKHSKNNLRNSIYFATGLTVASFAATIWFLGTYFFGMEKNIWKGIACGVATYASCQRLLQFWMQLSRTGRHPAKLAPKKQSAE